MKKKQRKGNALELAERLVQAIDAGNADVRNSALAVLVRLRLPMTKILEKVPGDSVTAKAKAVGASRMAFYNWMNGTTRPRLREAHKISEVTGYSVAEIAGMPQ